MLSIYLFQNVNGGNFGANKQGGWSQGGPGNKPGGNFGPKGFGPKQQQGQGPARNQQRNNMGRGPQDGGKPQQREVNNLN